MNQTADSTMDEKKPKKEKKGHSFSFLFCVDQIYMMLLENDVFTNREQRNQFTQTVCEKFKVETRQAQRYIKVARERLDNTQPERIEEARQMGVRQRDFVLGKLFEDKDWQLALKYMDSREKLKGCFVDQEVSEVTVRNIEMSQFTEYGLEKLKRGEKLEDVLLDPKSLKQNANTDTSSS